MGAGEEAQGQLVNRWQNCTVARQFSAQLLLLLLICSRRCSFNLNKFSPPLKLHQQARLAMPLACHDIAWPFRWSFSFLGAASSLRVERKGDWSLYKRRRLQWAQGPAGRSVTVSVAAQVAGRLLCSVPLFLLPSLSYQMKLEEQSLLDVQDWSQRDSLSFGLGWGIKGMVHLITFINMTTRHVSVLWNCSLRTRLPTQTLSRKPCSMTFKLKTGRKKNKALIIKAEIIIACWRILLVLVSSIFV